jgi:Ca2+-dependent lipid-binding protein
MFKGVLRVHVHLANNVRAVDLDGLATPFAEVFVAASSFRTDTQRKTLNPVWDEVHWLYIK